VQNLHKTGRYLCFRFSVNWEALAVDGFKWSAYVFNTWLCGTDPHLLLHLNASVTSPQQHLLVYGESVKPAEVMERSSTRSSALTQSSCAGFVICWE